jgi:DNA-binding MarR family transcriptional regulator
VPSAISDRITDAVRSGTIADLPPGLLSTIAWKRIKDAEAERLKSVRLMHALAEDVVLLDMDRAGSHVRGKWLTQEQIAARTGLHQTTVSKALQRLADRGLVMSPLRRYDGREW